jgi:hypothetical protein
MSVSSNIANTRREREGGKGRTKKPQKELKKQLKQKATKSNCKNRCLLCRGCGGLLSEIY